MNRYITRQEAEALIASDTVSFVDDSTERPITEPFSSMGVTELGGRAIEVYPSGHPILRHLGRQPLKILDIAAGYGTLGLHMASLGHDVTVADIGPEECRWQDAAAAKMKLNNFAVVQKDVLSMQDDQQYDVVIAGMLLHFLERIDANKALKKIQNATKVGGLNAISVYTEDNPSDEKKFPRNLVDLYDGASDIMDMYSKRHWVELERREGISSRPVDRSYLGKDVVLMPSVANVVTKKISHPIAASATAIPDFQNWDDFQSYVID